PGMTKVKFEPFVGDEATPDYFHVADQWMAEVVRLWDLRAELDMIQRAKHWHFDCKDVYTLLPDGTLMNRCPHLVEAQIPEACYNCANVSNCKPCPIQRYCSYLPETVKAVKEKEGINDDERY
ncbi:MAG: hypothetical protein NC131_11295, partial [Roseburia sp.]|nr:hypothetical protein [Roseburia sp.]